LLRLRYSLQPMMRLLLLSSLPLLKLLLLKMLLKLPLLLVFLSMVQHLPLLPCHMGMMGEKAPAEVEMCCGN
jgi:hypothetical protein